MAQFSQANETAQFCQDKANSLRDTSLQMLSQNLDELDISLPPEGTMTSTQADHATINEDSLPMQTQEVTSTLEKNNLSMADQGTQHKLLRKFLEFIERMS